MYPLRWLVFRMLHENICPNFWRYASDSHFPSMQKVSMSDYRLLYSPLSNRIRTDYWDAVGREDKGKIREFELVWT